MIPGEYILAEEPVIANEGRRDIELEIANTGDRPIQVGSHFHFFEVNRALRFDRAAAFRCAFCCALLYFLIAFCCFLDAFLSIFCCFLAIFRDNRALSAILRR